MNIPEIKIDKYSDKFIWFQVESRVEPKVWLSIWRQVDSFNNSVKNTSVGIDEYIENLNNNE